MTSNRSSLHILIASSPVLASRIDLALGAIHFLSRRPSMVRFISMSSMTRKESGSLITFLAPAFPPAAPSGRRATSSSPRGDSHCRRGRRITHVVPGRIVGSDSKYMLPPPRSTMFLAMARPRPDPGAPPRCTNFLNSRPCSDLGMPGPVSMQSNLTNFSATPLPPLLSLMTPRSHRTRSVTVPSVVYLMALVTTFVSTCWRRCESARTQSPPPLLLPTPLPAPPPTCPAEAEAAVVQPLASIEQVTPGRHEGLSISSTVWARLDSDMGS
mmetsp:Transcript_14395/g.42207  ORF Transcript_14395/g.42207 Transcript_14395/m.42207 type:complete len:270 (+) Transcript_14395:439-1248(+)